MQRSLKHYWKLNASVALGAAVATAVLTGALLVGDSVKGSLRRLTLERLGAIDHALVAARFFRAELATDLQRASGAARVLPATMLSGSAVHARTRARATRVQIVGAAPGLGSLLGGELDFGHSVTGERAPAVFPPAIVNRSLMEQLGAGVGDDLVLSFERQTAVPRESLFGRRASSDVVERLRVRLHGVVENGGVGRFGLRPHQAQSLSVFIPLAELQRALERPGRANALLVDAGQEADLTTAQLEAALSAALTLEDLELSVRSSAGVARLESRRFLIDAATAAAARRAAVQVAAPHAAVLTYLANAITADGKAVPYSTVTALDPVALQATAGALRPLRLTDGSDAPTVDDDGILISEWVAADLAVSAGDSLTLSYYTVGSREELETRQTVLQVRGVTAMDGLGGDRHLTPDYPGIQGAHSMADWSAPFPIDLNRIRELDEAYWQSYGATPKAFVSEATGRRLWSNRFGAMTSLPVGAAPGRSLAATVAALEQALLRQLRPRQAGLVFQPVRSDGLKAAEGATDFSMLFIGFSLFIIAAAVLLVILLFKLGVEQRIREIGLLLGVGFTVGAIRRRFLAEGLVLAAAGGLVGTLGAVGYGWAMMAGLRYLWQDAVGTPDLQLYVEATSLGTGLAAAVVIVAAAIATAVRRYARLPVRSLLAGSTGPGPGTGTARRATIIALVAAATAAAATIAALGADSNAAAGLFFLSGAALLVCALSAISNWMKGRPPATGRRHGLGGVGLGMGVRNARRQPGRSMLCVSLIACACFVIVAVGASGRRFADRDDDGADVATTGGFTLLAEAEVGLFQSLGSREGRFALGLSSGAEAGLAPPARVYPFRSRAGEDASCLNLYKPDVPRVLGVPDEMIARGGFRFKQLESPPHAQPIGDGNPWSLLRGDFGPGVVPAFADYNSAQWILHLGLGDRLVLDAAEGGEPVELLLVGLLDRSIFQSELLVSAANFERSFPTNEGFSFFAFELPAERDAGQLAADLERDLEGYGFDAMSAGERAARFQAVENTYLSTFQMLGGLGLVLGTIGLAVVSIRNALERTGELAVQRAFGFTRRRLYRMLLIENGALLLIGVALGSACALVAVVPHLGAASALPWKSLAGTLALVVAVGMASAALAASFALRARLLPALKSA